MLSFSSIPPCQQKSEVEALRSVFVLRNLHLSHMQSFVCSTSLSRRISNERHDPLLAEMLSRSDYSLREYGTALTCIP